MWTWIVIGVGAFFVLAATVALVVAGTLGVIADDIAALYETEEWAALPLTREADLRTEAETEEEVLTA
jgi:hypothetical protein